MIKVILSVFSVFLQLCIIPTAWLVYKKKLNFLNGVFLGTFLFLMSFGCSVYGTHLLSGYSIIDYTINTYFEGFIKAYESIPGISAGDIQMIKTLTEEVKGIYFTYMPTLIVTTNLILSYVILMICKGVLALFKKDISGFGKFCDLKMPKSAMFFAIISYLLFMVFGDERIGFAFLNFASIMYTLTAFCGLSIIDYGLRKKIKFSLLRAVIYIVVIGLLTLMGGLGTSLLTFAGMYDAFFDIRNRKRKTM